MIKQDLKLAAGILALFVVILYFPITFSDHSYSPSFTAALGPYDVEREHGCIEDCIFKSWTIDPGADGNQFWPVIKLISTLYSEGTLPLWNPYLGAGVPLAADQAVGVYSPLMPLYLLPSWLWDVPLLVSIWLAGLFTFLLLGCWKLNYTSRLIGSLLFMFSGSITWYLPHDSIPVLIFAPLLLYSIEKIIQDNKIRYTILGGITFSAAILGAHIETIALLVFFYFAYFAFRFIQLTITQKNKTTSGNTVLYFQTHKKSVLAKFAIIFVIGLGLTAFTILPTYEYLTSSGPLDHPTGAGLKRAHFFTSVSTFIPTFSGFTHVYPDLDYKIKQEWKGLGITKAVGYIASSTLFFSIIGIAFSNKIENKTFRYIPMFFFGIAIFFVLKSIGFPGINLIGHLPVFEYVNFSRYDIFIWCLGFSIAAAFGIQAISERKINKKQISVIIIISVLIIILLSLLIISFLVLSNSQESMFFIFSMSHALIFIIAAFLLTLTFQNKKNSLLGILILVAIELSLYIPMGLYSWWPYYKSLAVLIGTLSIVIATILPYVINSLTEKEIKKIIIGIFIAVMISQAIVYEQSPAALPIKNDDFESTQLTIFLKENLDNHRIFHLDGAFLPNYPAVYEIQTLGIVSSFNPETFHKFVYKFLDPYTRFHLFNYQDDWREKGAPPLLDTFEENKKYYDFLGVKYLVAFGTNPNTSKPDYPLNAHVVLGTENGVNQAFISKHDTLASITTQLGTFGVKNLEGYGDVILTVDSIPYDEANHRESRISAENLASGQFNPFTFDPISNAANTKFVMNLQYQKTGTADDIAAFILSKKHPTKLDVDQIIQDVGGEVTIDDKPLDAVLLFSYGDNDLPLVYQGKPFNVYENTQAFPRSFMVYDYEVVNTFDEAFENISDPNFDLRNKVILEQDLPIEQKLSFSSGESKIISYEANTVKLSVTTESPGLLILTDNYYPGWKAKVDGVESKVYRADGLVRAVYIPAGNHDVEFYFLPDSFVNGLMISLSTAGILGGFLAYSRFKN